MCTCNWLMCWNSFNEQSPDLKEVRPISDLSCSASCFPCSISASTLLSPDLRQMKPDKERTHLVADRSGGTGKTRRSMFCLWRSKLRLHDRDLDLCHKLCLIATTLIFKAEFPIGAADVIAIAFNPFEKSVVDLLYGAETAMMD